MKFTLDSNVAVDVLRSAEWRAAAESFLRWAAERVYLSAVVVAELEAGARTQAAREWLDERILARFARRGRILAPSAGVWRSAGHLLSAEADRSPRAARQNDTLLALQAREEGWIVITRDEDFDRLRKVLRGLRVVAPFPSPLRTDR